MLIEAVVQDAMDTACSLFDRAQAAVRGWLVRRNCSEVLKCTLRESIGTALERCGVRVLCYVLDSTHSESLRYEICSATY